MNPQQCATETPSLFILFQHTRVDLTGLGTFFPTAQRSPEQDILTKKEDIITGSIPKGYGFPEYTPGMAGSSCKSGVVSITFILEREKGGNKNKNKNQPKAGKNTTEPSATNCPGNERLNVGTAHQFFFFLAHQFGSFSSSMNGYGIPTMC